MSGAQLQQPALALFPPGSRAGQHRAPFPPPPPIFPHLPRRPAAQRACTLRRAPPSVLPAPPSPGRCPCGRCQRRLGWLDSQHLRGEPSSPIFLSSPRRSTRACMRRAAPPSAIFHHRTALNWKVPPFGRCPRRLTDFVRQHSPAEPSSPIFVASPRRGTRARVAPHHLPPSSAIVPPSL